jgi:hypothetical protein
MADPPDAKGAAISDVVLDAVAFCGTFSIVAPTAPPMLSRLVSCELKPSVPLQIVVVLSAAPPAPELPLVIASYWMVGVSSVKEPMRWVHSPMAIISRKLGTFEPVNWLSDHRPDRAIKSL